MNPRMTPFLSQRILLLAAALVYHLVPASSAAQIGGGAGAYARMGFGARGMAMGNALTAVTTGDAVGYYNPATLPLAEYRNITASFGVLTLDRRLNFLSYVQPLGGGASTDPEKGINKAGLTIGIINAGISNIDGRDADGQPTGLLKTSENQAFLGFGTQLRNGLAIGVTIKFLYYHLYTDVNSTTFGFDVGALMPVSKRLTLGIAVRDINAKYSWDTQSIYGQQGTTTTDKFPQLYIAGAAFILPDSLGLIAADLEFSNRSTTYLKIGAEVPVIPEVTLRAGIDRIDLRNKGYGVRPGFGFTARKSFEDLHPALTYAFVIEPFASSGLHMISLSMVF